MRTTFRIDDELADALGTIANEKHEGNISSAVRTILREHCISQGLLIDKRKVTIKNKQQFVAGGDISIQNSGSINISDNK